MQGGTPRTATAQLTTAATKIDLISGVTATSPVIGVLFVGNGTVTVGRIDVYLFNNSTDRLVGSFLVTAAAPSSTVAAWQYLWVPSMPITLMASTWKLKAAPSNSETFDATASVEDLG